MKRIIAFALLAFTAFAVKASVPSVNEFPGTDSRITYVGRTLAGPDGVSFDWSGSGIRIRFNGTCLALRVSDTDKDYYNLWIDREPGAEADKVVAMAGKDTVIVLFDAREGLEARAAKRVKPTEHTVWLNKRTEGEQGKTTVHAVLTDGTLLQAPGVKSRIIEVVGDSNTCGYGSENSVASDPFTKETENCNKSFASILGRYFDADVYLIAHSGMGIARNYRDKLMGYCMPDRYLNVFDDGFDKRDDTPLWNPSNAPKPDITIVYLAANDFSVQRQPTIKAFTDGYLRLLREIKELYGPQHPVLCAASRPEYYDYVLEAVERCGMENVTMFGVGSLYSGSDERGASSHPNYQAHRKLAHCFIPYVATMTGWGLQDAAVR